MSLEDDVLAVLQPQSMRERVQRRLSGGVTPVQVFHRLSTGVQQRLLDGESNGEVAVRKAMASLQQCLDELEKQQRVLRKKVKMQTQDGRGPRTILVDVYRINRRQ